MENNRLVYNLIANKKVILIILSIQMAMSGLVALEILGYDIPVIRPVIGFIYLTFVPGYLLLKTLISDKLKTIEVILFSVGLSLALIMFMGFFMNSIYPLIGITRPISILPVFLTISCIILLLSSYLLMKKLGDDKAHTFDFKKLKELYSPATLFLILLPILSIISTILIYPYNNNILALIVLFLIAGTIVIAVFLPKHLPSKIYAILILSISLSILWSKSLVAPSIYGFDGHMEFYALNLVVNNSIWDSNSIYGSINAMLSVVMLAPIYSIIMKLDPLWVFKGLYPLLFSFFPVALYEIYRSQIKEKVAMLSVFLVMSFPVFFSEDISMIRQPIAELFLALTFLVLIKEGLSNRNSIILFFIFSISIVVSHYSIFYFYIYYFIAVIGLAIILYIFKFRSGIISIISSEKARIYGLSRDLVNNKNTIKVKAFSFMLCFFLIFIFALYWFSATTSGVCMNDLNMIKNHLVTNKPTEETMQKLVINNSSTGTSQTSTGTSQNVISQDNTLLNNSLIKTVINPATKDPIILEALGLLSMRSTSISWQIARVFQYVTQIFIVVGMGYLLINWKRTTYHTVFKLIAFASMSFIILCIMVPYLATYFTMNRIYYITLFSLAPFCILGGITSFKALNKIPNLILPSSKRVNMDIDSKWVAILVIVPYFLFTTGTIFALTGATPTSFSISFNNADWSIFTVPEVKGANWLYDNIVYSWKSTDPKDGYGVSADLYGATQLNSYFPIVHTNVFYNRSYFFLRNWNVKNNELLYYSGGNNYINISSTPWDEELLSTGKVYDNGYSQILGPAKIKI